MIFIYISPKFQFFLIIPRSIYLIDPVKPEGAEAVAYIETKPRIPG